MKIQTIEITNYKAFYGHHKIAVGGKNLFIYGENGSGKSSLYYALKDFFQGSMEDIDLTELDNIFLPAAKKGKTAIKVTFKPSTLGPKQAKAYTFNATKNDTRAPGDTSIRDGNKLKSFLTYKHLLTVHHLKKDGEINLFDLLVKSVLKHLTNPLTKGKELGELWDEVEECIGRSTGKVYQANKKKTDVNTAIKAFNEAFGELFKPKSPEYILRHAKPILDKFHHNIELKLKFPQVRPNSDYSDLEGVEVSIDVKFAEKKVQKPHLFLNEARLSAIAISIYLGMIKRHAQRIPCKTLFLDDIFIGLDIANRMPLLEILETEFPDYQIFITTYDKPWFEYATGFLDKSRWKTVEFYARQNKEGYDIPYILDGQNLIDRAEEHLKNCDYKAAAVYARSGFEKIIREHCEKKRKKIAFKSQLRSYQSEDFWREIEDDVRSKTKADIKKYRALVLNTFSHYNAEKHELKGELKKAIQAVKELEGELLKLQSKAKSSSKGKSKGASGGKTSKKAK